MLPPVTSGPIGGNGCVVNVEQVGQFVQTFHQLRPVPPLECAVVGRKNDGGNVVLLGTVWLNAAPLLAIEVGTSDVLLHVVDHPGSLELPHHLTAAVIVS